MNQLTHALSQFNPTTPRRAVMWVIGATVMVLLAGCQAMGAKVDRAAVQGWQQARMTASKIVSGLRTGPEAEPAFYHGPTGDAALNTRLLEERVWVAVLNAGEPLVVREAVNRTLDNGVMVYRPGQGRSVVRTPRRLAPAYQLAPQPTSSTDSFGYVRVDGPSDGADWQRCEARVGGAFLVGPRGAEIAPDFDTCMRDQGYLPESEAEQKLELTSGYRGLRGSSRP